MPQELRNPWFIALMQVFVFLVLLVWLLGCGGPMLFTKPDASDLDLKNDSYDCDQEWSRSGPGQAYAADPLGSLGYLATAGWDKQACMERKGWVRVHS